MNVMSDLPPTRADDATSPPSGDLLLHHPVFCQFALPLRAQPKGVWRREFGTASVAIEAGDEVPLPAGKYLRLLLIHIFDTAIRNDSNQVDLGEDAAALAASVGTETKGPKLRELADQVARLVASRVTVAADGAAPLGVFDARGRQRTATPAWRPTIRLNARFFGSLGDGAVALRRDVVAALADQPAALDLYAWLAWAFPRADPGGEVTAGWEEIRSRFAAPAQSVAELRSGFTESLALLQQSWPGLACVISDDGVTFRRIADPAPAGDMPVMPEAAAEPPPERPPEPVGSAPKRRPHDATAVPDPDPDPDPAPPREPPADSRSRTVRQTLSLRSHLTGLQQVIWLQRAQGRDILVIEVTPGGRYDSDSVTVIALEPVTLQVSGGLYTRDFERVAAWATANRDLIEDWWDGRIDSFEDAASRVRKVPAPGWR